MLIKQKDLQETYKKAEYKPRFFPELSNYSAVKPIPETKNKLEQVERRIELLLNDKKVQERGSTYLMLSLEELHFINEKRKGGDLSRKPLVADAIKLLSRNIESVKPTKFLKFVELLDKLGIENKPVWQTIIKETEFRTRLLGTPFETTNREDVNKVIEILSRRGIENLSSVCFTYVSTQKSSLENQDTILLCAVNCYRSSKTTIETLRSITEFAKENIKEIKPINQIYVYELALYHNLLDSSFQDILGVFIIRNKL